MVLLSALLLAAVSTGGVAGYALAILTSERRTS